MDTTSESVDSSINGNLSAAALCQGLGADVFRTVRSWTSQESLLQKYCSGSCRNSRLFQGRNMSSRDAAMYTVLAIRRRLATAAKDPACACSSCNATTALNPQPLAARSKISSSKWASCQWPKKYVESQINQTAEEETGDVVKFSFRGSNLEGGLKGFENVIKRTSNGAYRSPRCLAVTKHPMNPGGSSIISL